MASLIEKGTNPLGILNTLEIWIFHKKSNFDTKTSAGGCVCACASVRKRACECADGNVVCCAMCSTLCTVCCSALCAALCALRCVLCAALCALRCVLCAALCALRCVLRYVLCAPCGVLCAVCCVLTRTGSYCGGGSSDSEKFASLQATIDLI
jgi:hypothetical protein